MDKYTSLQNYSSKLIQSICKFDNMYYITSSKQLKSLKISFSSLTNILDNMLMIQENLNKIKQIPKLDELGKKGNKNAKRADEEIKSIVSELRVNYSKLEQDFYSQMSICCKQCRQLQVKINGKENYERFSKDSRDFQIMGYEAEHEKYKIPFHQKNQYKESRKLREHKKDEIALDEVTRIGDQGFDKLQEAQRKLSTILLTVPKDDLYTEVKKEVAQINKALPPRMIAISKQNLERLRHSSHLLLDLEQINELFKTTSRFTGKNGKLQQINKKLDNLKILLVQAIEEEKRINMHLMQEHRNAQSKVSYAVGAVETYGSILNDNADLEVQKRQIMDNTHGYYEQNTRLEKEAQEKIQESVLIERKDERLKEANDGLKVEQLRDEARELREQVHDNEKYMQDTLSKRSISQLPIQYTQMKKRLKEISSLNAIQFNNENELNSGGRRV